MPCKHTQWRCVAITNESWASNNGKCTGDTARTVTAQTACVGVHCFFSLLVEMVLSQTWCRTRAGYGGLLVARERVYMPAAGVAGLPNLRLSAPPHEDMADNKDEEVTAASSGPNT